MQVFDCFVFDFALSALGFPIVLPAFLDPDFLPLLLLLLDFQAGLGLVEIDQFQEGKLESQLQRRATRDKEKATTKN